jgi:hypothetical protein
LDPDQVLVPAIGEDAGLPVDAIDAEAMLLLERRPLAGDSLDEVIEAGGLVVVGSRSMSIATDMVASGGSVFLREGSEGVGSWFRIRP